MQKKQSTRCVLSIIPTQTLTISHWYMRKASLTYQLTRSLLREKTQLTRCVYSIIPTQTLTISHWYMRKAS